MSIYVIIWFWKIFVFQTIDTTDTVNGNKLLQFYMLICKKLLNCPKLYNDLICTLKILQSGPASDFLKQIDVSFIPLCKKRKK